MTVSVYKFSASNGALRYQEIAMQSGLARARKRIGRTARDPGRRQTRSQEGP